MIKIAAPVTEPGQVKPLCQAGADEIYLGYMPQSWFEKFGDHDSASRRQGKGNVLTEPDFVEILSLADTISLPVSLALNVRYTQEQSRALHEMLWLFTENGGEAVIFSDITLGLHIAKHFPHLKLYLSLLAVAASAAAVSFYRDIGVSRIIFPRFMSYEHMREISAQFPDVEFEAMAFFNNCRYIDGFCRYIHAVGRAHGCALVKEQECVLNDGVMDCGACNVAELCDAGINVLKIGGRGFPAELPLNAVRTLKAALDGEKPKDAYRRAFGTDCHLNCYRTGEYGG